MERFYPILSKEVRPMTLPLFTKEELERLEQIRREREQLGR